MFNYNNEIKYMNNKYWSQPIKRPESELEKEANNSTQTIDDLTNYFSNYYSSSRGEEVVFERDSLGGGANYVILGLYSVRGDTASVAKHQANYFKTKTAVHELVHKRRAMTGEPQDEYLVERETERMNGLVRFNYH